MCVVVVVVVLCVFFAMILNFQYREQIKRANIWHVFISTLLVHASKRRLHWRGKQEEKQASLQCVLLS